MLKMIEEINLPSNSNSLKLLLKERLKKNPNAEFYIKADHEGGDNGELCEIDGRVILSASSVHNDNFMVHDNPWKDARESYYANYYPGDEEYLWYTPKECRESYNRKEFLWINFSEIKHLEMRCELANNKEAARTLERYDD